MIIALISSYNRFCDGVVQYFLHSLKLKPFLVGLFEQFLKVSYSCSYSTKGALCLQTTTIIKYLNSLESKSPPIAILTHKRSRKIYIYLKIEGDRQSSFILYSLFYTHSVDDLTSRKKRIKKEQLKFKFNV